MPPKKSGSATPRRSSSTAKRAKPKRPTTRDKTRAKGHKDARHVMMSAALESAARPGLAYEGEDEPVFCNKGIAKGMSRSRAVELFQAVYPDYPESYIRTMNREKLCDKISHARVNEVTQKLCADVMDANATQAHLPHLRAIAAALEGKPEAAYRDMPKRSLCEIVSENLRVHQRFRFLRSLIPSSVMSMILKVVKRLADTAGDASTLIMSVPAIEQIIDFMPNWVKASLLGFGAARALTNGESGKDRGWFFVSAIPMLFNLAGKKIPSDLVAGISLLNPNRSLTDSMKFAGATGAYVAGRGVTRTAAEMSTDQTLKEARDAAVRRALEDYALERNLIRDLGDKALVRYPEGGEYVAKVGRFGKTWTIPQLIESGYIDVTRFEVEARGDADYASALEKLDAEYDRKREEVEEARRSRTYEEVGTGGSREQDFNVFALGKNLAGRLWNSS